MSYRTAGLVVAFLAWVAAAGSAAAQTPTLLRDVRTVPDEGGGLQPAFIGTHGSAAYFAGTSDAHGVELWRSDGTTAGTVLVKDIWPGAAGSGQGRDVHGSSFPRDIHSAGGLVYFSAEDGDTGRELWRSDGTESGTFRLGDFAPGLSSGIEISAPGLRLAAAGSVFVFPANDGVNGKELWRTDGTVAGTSLLVDACPGPCSAFGFNNAISLGGFAYFAVGDSIWRTDGTPAGTVPAVQTPGLVSFNPLVPIGDLLFFGAFDGQFGYGLWVTDGTQAGTRLVKSVSIDFPTAVGSLLFFRGWDASAGTEIWRSDGTTDGTFMVKDIRPGPEGSSIWVPVDAGGVAYFTANDGTHGQEVWRSDGTEAGTALVLDVNPGADTGAFQIVWPHGQQVVFVGSSPSGGSALWWSDGTPGGTRPVGPASPHPTPGGTFAIASAGPRVFFSGATAQGLSYRHELWRSDGTEAGTAQVSDIRSVSSSPHSLTVLPGRIAFAAGDEAGFEPWATDGTTPGTARLGDLCPGACSTTDSSQSFFVPSTFAALGPHAYFAAEASGTGQELWRTDGSAAGTTLAVDVLPGSVGSGPAFVTSAGSRVFFRAWAPALGHELWASDGTPAGTNLTSDIRPGPDGASIYQGLSSLAGSVFFAADDGVNGQELFTSDGTPAGTRMVADLTSGPVGTGILELTPAAGLMFFVRVGALETLYRTDGTGSGTYGVTGTVLLDSAGLPAAFTGVENLAAAGSLLFFRASTPGSGSELWRSDGTVQGTRRVRDIAPGPGDARPANFADVGGVLYFTASDGSHGVELWRSDGSEAGTFMVRDIVPGAVGSRPSALAAVNGRLYFAAYTPAAGVELWTSDGTEGGTVLVHDVAAGPASSSPDRLTLLGDRLVFTADDGVHGREPWVIDGVLPSLIVSRAARAEGDSGVQPLSFSLTVVGVAASDVTAKYATQDGTATAGTDYQAAAGSVTFPTGGSASLTVPVGLIGDTTPEADEDFELTLSSAVGAVLVGSPARGVVLDDDSPVTVSAEDASLPEGDAGRSSIEATVRLSGPRGVPVTVDYSTDDGTATDPSDYEARSGTLTFLPGATAQTATIALRGDRDLELDETFALRLASPTNASLGDAEGALGILNDEPGFASGHELTHGAAFTGRLGVPGVFRIGQKPHASYEVVLDATSGDASSSQLALTDLTGFGAFAYGETVGTGAARSLRWTNSTDRPIDDQVVRLYPTGCVGTCDPGSRYRIRAYETTVAVPRFANVGAQRTVLLVQNRGRAAVTGTVDFWAETGQLLHSAPLAIAPRAVFALDTAGLGAVAGRSGSITIAHDGRYGDLVGKAAAADVVSGLSADTPFVLRPR